MTTNTTMTGTPTAAEVLAAAPPMRHEPGARERIRAGNVAAGRRIAILDDDPTGSQTVHDVASSPSSRTAEYAAGLAEPGSTCFILTNTRSLPEDAAVELTTSVAGRPVRLGQTLGAPVRGGQPERLHPARPRDRRDARARRGPAPGHRQRVRRDAADPGVLRGRPVHRRRHPLGQRRRGTHPGRGQRIRPGRHLRLHLLEPAGLRRREERRHDHRRPGAQPVA